MGLFASLRREYIYIVSVARTLYLLRHVRPHSRQTVVDLFERRVARAPGREAICCGSRVFTYRELDEGANRYAHWALAQGIGRGEVVVLFMENRAEYVMAWLGLLKLGAVVALINSHLVGAALAHCVNIAKARHVILGAELGEVYGEVAQWIAGAPKVWATGGAVAGAEDLDAALAKASPAPVPKSARAGLRARDNAFYIYTSGTTGLPKAANFSHMKMLFMMFGFVGGLNAKPTDRTYCALPLYHATGGICAVGIALVAGGTLIVKRKFSAHEFWADCRRYRATIFIYVGELCRYLLNAPPDAADGIHDLRVITGNGLRPEIWPVFQKRFAIPRIVEFYGATEGNVSMLNYDGTVGAVGRMPWYIQWLLPTRILRFDIERGEVVRGADGFCIECEPGEVGEAAGRISARAGRTFEGYTQSQDAQRKILRDAFRKGDAWFRTGDLMRRDRHAYYYFVDRIGDTFRWKGENVATSEVAEALGVIAGVREANVYGVTVPGRDGRAGMAAIVAGPEFDVASLAGKLAVSLAPFARPVFLRLMPELDITGTFKLRKVDLVKEGFDPTAIANPLYWLDPATGTYRPLDRAAYEAICAGGTKL